VADVMADIGKRTANECFAMNMDTKEIIARVNAKPRSAESVESSESANA
jgi:hypothetical protein